MVDERKETRRTQRSRAALLSPVQQTRRRGVGSRRVAAALQPRRSRGTAMPQARRHRRSRPALPTQTATDKLNSVHAEHEGGRKAYCQ